jgi:RNA polymerase sigma-70 factor (ECF subfamily)
VALNRAVAVAMTAGPEAGLRALDELVEGDALDSYLYLHSTRADFLRRLHRHPEARAAYRRALELADNAVERRFLTRRLAEVEG